GRLGLVPGEPQQRESRLCVMPVAHRLPVHCPRLDELSAQAMELALLVAGAPQQDVGAAREMAARQACRGERRGPVALQLEYLGAVHQALASKRDQVRLGGAPVIETTRPLPRSFQVEGPLARQDDRAIDD